MLVQSRAPKTHHKTRMKLSHQAVYDGLYGLLLLLVSLSLAWILMFKFDFFYGLWHDYGGIKEGIDRYGPQNAFKPGFGETTRDQRVEAFRQINLAVHRGGEGLADIRYQSPTSGGVQTLLREPELVHLQDVANLIADLRWLVLAVCVLWPLAALLYFRRYAALPTLKFQALGLLICAAVVGLLLLGFGAENVFNALHIWLFPKENQWFFYYQESLMSTMMLAPRLFAWIAAAWALLSVLLFFTLTLSLNRLTGLIRARSVP